MTHSMNVDSSRNAILTTSSKRKAPHHLWDVEDVVRHILSYVLHAPTLRPYIHLRLSDITKPERSQLSPAALTCKQWYELAKTLIPRTKISRSVEEEEWVDEALDGLRTIERIAFLLDRNLTLDSRRHNRLCEILAHAHQCKELFLVGLSALGTGGQSSPSYPVLRLPNLQRSLTTLSIEFDATDYTSHPYIRPQFNIWSVLQQLPHLRHLLLTNADLLGHASIWPSVSMAVKLESLILTRVALTQEGLDTLVWKLCTPALQRLRILPHPIHRPSTMGVPVLMALEGVPFLTARRLAVLSPNLEAVELGMLPGDGGQAIAGDDSDGDSGGGGETMADQVGAAQRAGRRQSTGTIAPVSPRHRMFNSLVALYHLFPRAAWKAVHVPEDSARPNASFDCLYADQDLSLVEVQARDRHHTRYTESELPKSARNHYHVPCLFSYGSQCALMSFLRSSWSRHLVELNMIDVPLTVPFLQDSAVLMAPTAVDRHRADSVRVLRIGAAYPLILKKADLVVARLRLLFGFIVAIFPRVCHLEIHYLKHDANKDNGLCFLSRLAHLETLVLKTSSLFQFPVFAHAEADHRGPPSPAQQLLSSSSSTQFQAQGAFASKAKWPKRRSIMPRTEAVIEDFNWMIQDPPLPTKRTTSKTSLSASSAKMGHDAALLPPTTLMRRLSRYMTEYFAHHSESLHLGYSLQVCRAIASKDTIQGYFGNYCVGHNVLWEPASHVARPRRKMTNEDSGGGSDDCSDKTTPEEDDMGEDDDGYRHPGCRWSKMRLFRIEFYGSGAESYACRVEPSVELARKVRPDIRFEVVSFQDDSG